MKRLRILKWVVFGLTAITLLGLVTMLLWNWLIPSVLGFREITFLQSLGLLLLAKILFWGPFGRRHWRPGHNGGWQWKERLREKFASMTPEEREAFKAKMREKWCGPAEEPNASKTASSND